MPSSLLQIRRSPAATVNAVIPAEGELAYKTDTKKLSIGDGSTLGGNGIVMDSQLATDTLAGIVEKATTAEAQAATANKFPDAAGVKSYVGQFGIGETSSVTTLDLDNINNTGCYRVDITTLNRPPVIGYGSVWHHQRVDSVEVTQIVTSVLGSLIATRNRTTAGWSGWGYFNPSLGSVSQEGGIPIGSVLEYGSNPNGTYLKFADGTMTCYQNVAINTAIDTVNAVNGYVSALQTFTFPVTFSSVSSYNISGVINRAMFDVTMGASVAQYRWISDSSLPSDVRYASFTITGRWY